MKYDCIVLGLGGVGSAALMQAAKRGWSVLGLEQLGVVHDQGSSHGQTRIIRTAYYEHPNYVPMARRAWDAWTEIQNQVNEPLIQKTGLLQIGPPDGEVIRGVLKSADEHEVPIESLSMSEVSERFPVFKVPVEKSEGLVGVFENMAGFLRVEKCVASLLKLAISEGAKIQANTTVEGWEVSDDGTIRLATDQGFFETERLIVSAGAWSTSDTKGVLNDLPLNLQVVRKQQQWFQIDRVETKYQNGFPCYLIETDNGCFYGFPELDRLGIKIGEHSGGQPVSDVTQLDREMDFSDVRKCEQFLDDYLVFSRRRLVHHSICMYTQSTDQHFVIDRHPSNSNIVFAAGLSGHGFKFTPLIAQRLVGLLAGETDTQFDFLQMKDRDLQAVS